MKNTKLLSVLFGVLFVLLLSGTALLAFTFRNAEPVVLASMEKADARSEAMMEALCSQDYAAASKLISGKPKLEPNGEPATALGKVLWEAYGESLSYEFEGSSYVSDGIVCRQVTVTMLDIPALMEDLQAKSTKTLAIKAASNPDEAYDADGAFRSEFVAEALAAEARSMVKSDKYMTERSLTLQLTGHGGKWVVCADRTLMDLFVGGMGGV